MAKFNASSLKVSTKHLQIDKANKNVIIAVSLTVVAVIFSAVISFTLIDTIRYQDKVISKLDEANKTLQKNIENVSVLEASYKEFENAPESVIGTDDKNSKIVLDSLPAQYDFAALLTSIEGIIKNSGNDIESIEGKDDVVNAQQSAINPTPVEIPFEFSAIGSYGNAKKLIADMERSIRPFKITKIKYSGSDGALTTEVMAVTYYQPAKKLEIDYQVVKKDDSKKTKKSTSSSKKNGESQ
jgi:Tfp pilus assembly protein PilO